MCSNLDLLFEAENYSVVSDYHSPVQQPSFSGALKVTRVEQMAQFPQLFRINESLLQRNANFQTLDCFLKQEWGKEKTFLSAILETGLTCLALVFPSLTECPPLPLPFIMKALLALGCQSSWLVCGKCAQLDSRAMPQCNGVTQLPVCCTLISVQSYAGRPDSLKRASWRSNISGTKTETAWNDSYLTFVSCPLLLLCIVVYGQVFCAYR